jgi:hypothetical protein
MLRKKTTTRVFLLVCLLMVSVVVAAPADTLKLKDGRTLDGYFSGGSARVIKFEVAGAIHDIPIESIVSLTFGTPQTSMAPSSPPPSSPPPSSAPPQQSAAALTVNAGTQIMIRTSDALDTGDAKSDDRFITVLEADLAANGVLIAPRGSTVYGRVADASKARRMSGKAKLVLELTGIMINNQLIPIMTGRLDYTGERQGTGKKVVAGAAVGGLIDGGGGAAKGAAVGVGAALLTKGKQIKIPAGTILEFRLSQPLTIR